jgi:hypothetical protein
MTDEMTDPIDAIDQGPPRIPNKKETLPVDIDRS